VKVIVEIDGRNAIPVRAIPFLTNWATMSPDVVADALAGEAHHFRGLASFCIEGLVQKRISTTWWENFPCRQLKALSDEIKAKEITHETGYQEWRSRSILILPAGVFVWQEDFETRHNYFHGPDGTSYLIEGNWLPENEQLTRVALDFDPFIPESHTQLIVMEGFHQPDAEASPSFEPLTKLIEQYATGKFEAMPVHLRERVAQAFFPMPHWDQLAPDQRRSLAQQNDVQHDPAIQPENEYWWQLTCRTQEVESEIKRWELMSDRGIPSEAVTKKTQLDTLRANLARLSALWNNPPFTVEDWGKPFDCDSSEIRPSTVIKANITVAKDPSITHSTGTAAATVSLQPQTVQSETPWLMIDPRDPPPVHAWYTPARYFARQLVKDDSTRLLKASILADMVAKSLAKVGINKRGGKKPFVADTILKAFSNVTLG
jgi:hypothetical protein